MGLSLSRILNTLQTLLAQKPLYHLLASGDYSPFCVRRGIQLEANFLLLGAFGNLKRDFWLTHWLESATGPAPVCWSLFYVYIAKEGNSCGKRDPFQGPKSGLLSNTWKWTVQGDSRADKARDFIKKGHQGESSKGNPGELLCHMAHSFRFYGKWFSFLVVCGQSFWLMVIPGGAHISQLKWI